MIFFFFAECVYRFHLMINFDVTEHARPTLFKKYMQVGADTARKYGGTGLGLAICKQLVSSYTLLLDYMIVDYS